MNPNDWYKKFLADRNLGFPTARPLYRYKIKSAEYYSLLDTLKAQPVNMLGWDACFVLFASEWWRREYNGGPWAWDPILVCIQKRNLPPTERAALVKCGLAKWGRNVNPGGRGNDYIGTIVIECGLPIKLLENEHYLPDIITDIYDELGAISAIDEEYIDVVRSIANSRLPETLQKDAFLFLLLECAQVLASLKAASREVLLNELLELFPLRMDGDPAKKFIDKLVNGTSEIQAKKRSKVFAAQKLWYATGEWQLLSNLIIKAGLHHITGLGISIEKFERLSPKLEIYLHGEEEKRIGFAYKKQEEQGYIISTEINLTLSEKRNRNWFIYLFDPKTFAQILINTAKADISQYNEPLIFGCTEGGEQNGWDFAGSGSMTLQPGVYRVLAGPGAQLEGPGWKVIASTAIGNPGKILYEINANCAIAEDGNTYQLNLAGQGDQFYYQFLQSRQTIGFYMSDNKHIFRGWPSIIRYRANGSYAGLVKAGVEYLTSSNNWQKAGPEIIGQVKVRYMDRGKTLFCRWVDILPENFSVSFNASEKSVIFAGSQNFNLRVYSEMPSSLSSQPSGHLLRFDENRAIARPTSFEASLQEKAGTGHPVFLKIPYPHQEIAFCGADGLKLSHKSAVFVHNMYETRLLANNFSATSMTLSIKLSLEVQGEHTDIAVKKWLSVPPYGNIDFSVNALKENAMTMFGATSNINACINLSCNEHSAIELHQFDSGRPLIENGYLRMGNGPTELSPAYVYAIRLDEPFEKENRLTLEFCPEENAWQLPSEDGVWFLYPANGSGRFFRPACYKQMPEADHPPRLTFKRFHQASSFKRDERLLALHDVVNRMAMDFRHPDWSQLELYFKEIQHLALSTLDVFTVLAESATALPAAAFRLNEKLTVRLSSDFSLIWFQYPVKNWLELFREYKTHVLANYPEAFDTIINRRLAFIGDNLGLTSIRWIIEKEALHLHEPFMLPKAVAIAMIEGMFNGHEQQPGLRARHMGESRWPNNLEQKIDSLYRLLPGEVTSLAPFVTDKYQKTAVYLPFILAAVSVNPGVAWINNLYAFKKYKVKEIIDFDEEWFTGVYNLVQAYLFYTNHNSLAI